MHKGRITSAALILFLVLPGIFLIAISVHLRMVSDYLLTTRYFECLYFLQNRFLFVENNNFDVYEKNNLILFYYAFFSTGLLVYLCVQYNALRGRKEKNSNTEVFNYEKLKNITIVILTLLGSFYLISNIHHSRQTQLSPEYIQIESIFQSPLLAELIFLYATTFLFLLCLSIIVSEVLFFLIMPYIKAKNK